MLQFVHDTRKSLPNLMSALPILSSQGLLLFSAGVLLFSLSPGPIVALITAYGFRSGFRAAVLAVCGAETGNTIWFVLSAAGFGAMATAWPDAFRLLRYAGAAYLVWLGLASLWHSRHAHAAAKAPTLRRAPFAQALLTQMGNPKAMLFFGAFLPPFLDTAAPLLPQYAVLYVVTLTGEAIVLCGYGWLAAKGGRMAQARHGLWRERLSGVMMLALGFFFAWTA